MTLKAAGGGGAGGGGRMIVCLVLFRLKQIIPTELACAGRRRSPKEYLSISDGIKRPVCILVSCPVAGICV